jgi:acyl-CoA synthetase (AMP-forming)/AMP-acid ligase II
MLIRGEQDSLAIVSQDGSTVTYGELRELSLRFKNLDFQRKVVLIVADNSLATLSTIAALIDAQAVPILFNSQTEDSSLIQIIERYNVQFIFGLSVRISDLCAVNVITEVDQNYGLFLIDQLREALSPHPSLAVLLTTSGSTGNPKLVRISGKNLATNADAIVNYLGITDRDRPILHLPVSYTYGLSILTSHLRAGATVYCTDESIVSRSFWEFIKNSRCTSLPGVPFTYSMLKKLRFMQMDLPHLKTLTQAGGKLSADLQREFGEWAIENDARFVVMYGQTEATARMSYLPPDRVLDKPGSIGIPISEGSFELVNDDNSEVSSPNVNANLIYKGPNVAMGYALNDFDLTLGDDFQGRLVTGDVAFKDDENFYYLVGRSDRHVKVFGYRINLDDVERIASELTAQVACVGKEDLVTIFVFGEEKLSEKEIKTHISQALNLNTIAFSVKILDEPPLTVNSKIDYRRLVEFAK